LPGREGAGFKVAVLKGVGAGGGDGARDEGEVVDVEVAGGIHGDGKGEGGGATGGGGLAGGGVEAPAGAVGPVADTAIVLGGVDQLEGDAAVGGGGGPG